MLKGRDMETMLHKYIPTMYEKEFPMNIHENSYLDLFPKQKLVYLTPHCREEMDTFDHDAVYIVGAIVDKVTFCRKILSGKYLINSASYICTNFYL